ncbi:MAG: FAD-binding domain-containing protein [Lacipirellulaceae bacterium]
MATQLVWFKRDLRLADHAPLVEAAKRGPCLCLYVYEPEWFRSPEFDTSHLVFVNESLAELREGLRRRGGELVVRSGAMPDVLIDLHATHPFSTVWAHEETGPLWSYARDRRVAHWARDHGVKFYEAPSGGVVRRLASRDGWAGAWQQRMNPPPLPAPERVPGPEALAETLEPGAILASHELGLAGSTKHAAQRGGESLAIETLGSFLRDRGAHYRRDMSSPNEGWDGCSRLSPYLAYGAISTRQAYHATRRRVAEVRGLIASGRGAGLDPEWPKSLESFEARLRWRCHFMQKLEDQPDLELTNMNRALDGLRPIPDEPARDGTRWNAEHFAAWREGRTGYPMIDATMRCLHATGWVNFRMRAMLASFAAYHLWLDWREPARYLATQFLDYEPGIHYAQFQMQSGVTGMNTIRIYSPVKQAADQDPHGAFIRRWVPELAEVPDEHLAEPHKLPPILQQDCGCVVGRDYPLPIVEHRVAYAFARDRMHALKRDPAVRAEAQRVHRKHGSRKRGRRG